jgi:diaminohydroxyphosphoribosylaminopyrimidine deaminase/5-amino-6-(5-phosphoribosylamino)uracil reductase
VLNEKKNAKSGNIEYVKIKFTGHSLTNILDELYKHNIKSVIVEGGTRLLSSFVKQGLWDEARVFISNKKIAKGIKAPVFKETPKNKIKIGRDTLLQYSKKDW